MIYLYLTFEAPAFFPGSFINYMQEIQAFSQTGGVEPDTFAFGYGSTERSTVNVVENNFDLPGRYKRLSSCFVFDKINVQNMGCRIRVDRDRGVFHTGFRYIFDKGRRWRRRRAGQDRKLAGRAGPGNGIRKPIGCKLTTGAEAYTFGTGDGGRSGDGSAHFTK